MKSIPLAVTDVTDVVEEDDDQFSCQSINSASSSEVEVEVDSSYGAIMEKLQEDGDNPDSDADIPRFDLDSDQDSQQFIDVDDTSGSGLDHVPMFPGIIRDNLIPNDNQVRKRSEPPAYVHSDDSDCSKEDKLKASLVPKVSYTKNNRVFSGLTGTRVDAISRILNKSLRHHSDRDLPPIDTFKRDHQQSQCRCWGTARYSLDDGYCSMFQLWSFCFRATDGCRKNVIHN